MIIRLSIFSIVDWQSSFHYNLIGKLPKDGLPQLEALVSSEYDWALSLTTKQFADPKVYNKFIRYFDGVL